MNTILLEQISFEPDMDRLFKTLRVAAESKPAERIRQLAAEAQGIARPRALYREAFVEEKGDDCVVVDGIRLTSRILRVNLEKVHRVFPYIATCGRELEDWSKGIDDILESFWADTIKQMALRAATAALERDLDERYQPGRTSSMNPGSLEDWPLAEQPQLFALLGNPYEAIGVELTESFLMVPIKSVSGLRFPTETKYENCQLCPRAECPGRRAPYEAGLYERRYGRKG